MRCSPKRCVAGAFGTLGCFLVLFSSACAVLISADIVPSDDVRAHLGFTAVLGVIGLGFIGAGCCAYRDAGRQQSVADLVERILLLRDIEQRLIDDISKMVITSVLYSAPGAPPATRYVPPPPYSVNPLTPYEATVAPQLSTVSLGAAASENDLCVLDREQQR
jgi:hypothetical protein